MAHNNDDTCENDKTESVGSELDNIQTLSAEQTLLNTKV